MRYGLFGKSERIARTAPAAAVAAPAAAVAAPAV